MDPKRALIVTQGMRNQLLVASRQGQTPEPVGAEMEMVRKIRRSSVPDMPPAGPSCKLMCRQQPLMCTTCGIASPALFLSRDHLSKRL